MPRPRPTRPPTKARRPAGPCARTASLASVTHARGLDFALGGQRFWRENRGLEWRSKGAVLAAVTWLKDTLSGRARSHSECKGFSAQKAGNAGQMCAQKQIKCKYQSLVMGTCKTSGENGRKSDVLRGEPCTCPIIQRPMSCACLCQDAGKRVSCDPENRPQQKMGGVWCSNC
jgi:hypothetical protein